MREISAQEFVRRFKADICELKARFTFFLGAGCSISSGIPGAGSLVKRWLRKLKEVKTGSADDLDNWAKEIFPNYNPDNPAASYSDVIEELFITPQARQRGIEAIVDEKDPGFGYAVLAHLITHDSWGGQCNSIITTNFDDMIADALYLYTNKKPVVIAHESLTDFVKITDIRPTVFKIHGDAKLAPMNTKMETSKITDGVKKALADMLSESGLVFIGYGGNDKTIAEILQGLPKPSLPSGVFWVADYMPETEIGAWLKDKDARWVRHRDFDELMLLVRNEFELKHPNEKRFEKITRTYKDTFKNLMEKLVKREDTPEKKILEDAAGEATKEFDNWFSYILEADKLVISDPEKAEKLYEEGFNKYNDISYYLSAYAAVLADYTKKYDKAENLYKKSLDLDPTNLIATLNYALFQFSIRGNMQASRDLYERALELDPENPEVLGRYANYLRCVDKDLNKVESYYIRAIELDSSRDMTLGGYAIFLQKNKKDYQNAESYFKLAINANPKNANNLGNYAGFLFSQGRSEEGKASLEDSYKNTVYKPIILEYWFYKYAHDLDDTTKTLVNIKKQVNAGDRSTNWNFDENVDRAIQDGHPQPYFLKILAKVISGEVDAKELEEFDIWRNISK